MVIRERSYKTEKSTLLHMCYCAKMILLFSTSIMSCHKWPHHIGVNCLIQLKLKIFFYCFNFFKLVLKLSYKKGVSDKLQETNFELFEVVESNLHLMHGLKEVVSWHILQDFMKIKNKLKQSRLVFCKELRTTSLRKKYWFLGILQ